MAAMILAPANEDLLLAAGILGTLAAAAAPTRPPAPPPEPPKMTEAEARRLAAEEGLALIPGNNFTGFKGVHYRADSERSGAAAAQRGLHYRAEIKQGGEHHKLGICLEPSR